MTLIAWSEKLSVGIPSVDEQHKMLINVINELNDALISGNSKDDIHKVFDVVKVYTIKHFSYEESLMQKYAYPQFEQHKLEHEKLISTLSELEERMNSGDFMIGVDLMKFLKNWLNQHILETDMEFSKLFISKGVQ